MAVKRAIRNTNMSREQMVDAINGYFGWRPPAKIGPELNGKRKFLSIHMFNHFLSKPMEYPMPAFYIFAIQRITESLELARIFAEVEEAKVICKDEERQLIVGKLDDHILEMQRLKKELRLRR